MLIALFAAQWFVLHTSAPPPAPDNSSAATR
jgi:hypothetical protein